MDIGVRRIAGCVDVHAAVGNSTFDIGFMNETEALEFAEKLIHTVDNICEYYDRPLLGDKGFVAQVLEK